jgi:hypothetical protein
MSAKGTYVYCLVAAPRKPARGRMPKGLQGTGPVRLIEASRGERRGDLDTWLVVADAPLEHYGEAAINQRLHDLDWVARAAVAHERVVESFIAAPAILPMKLFTIFTSDERALDDIARQRHDVRRILKRVTNHDEWGLRVTLDAVRAAAPPAKVASGARYLAAKKAMRDAAAERGARARQVVDSLYRRLAKQAGRATRRGAREPIEAGPMLLDAAFLVARGRARRFRASLVREARALHAGGYRVMLTGPWPPYSFLD